MNGHTFQCYDEQSDRRQFAKTLDALHGYVMTTLKNPDDLAPLFSDPMDDPEIERPEKDANATEED